MADLKVGSLVSIVFEKVVIVTYSLIDKCNIVVFKGFLKDCPDDILGEPIIRLQQNYYYGDIPSVYSPCDRDFFEHRIRIDI